MLDENASKFAIFLEYENPRGFFSFFISCYILYFFPNKCPSLCRHRPGHSFVKKYKVARNEKRKKLHGFSYT